MNKTELTNIRERKLGFSQLTMANLLNMPTEDYKLIEEGEYNLSLGEIQIISDLVKTYSIPRVNTENVSNILCDVMSNKEKADEIYSYDYNMIDRESNGRTREAHNNQMSKETILEHINNRAELGV